MDKVYIPQLLCGEKEIPLKKVPSPGAKILDPISGG
jgi:hypothetical protein